MRNKLMLWMLLLVLLSANVLALGVTPGRTTIDFTPNSKHTIEFNVINDQHKDMKALLYVEGENLSIHLHKQLLNFKANESSEIVKYDVKLPDELSPGKHTASIVIREIPESPESPQTFIGAYPAVITQLVVKVPYPGKYLEIEGMEVSESQVGEVTNFIIPVINLGTEKLLDIKATIDILGPTNEKIYTIETDSISLESKKRQLLKASWKADVNPGKYFAVATVTYDRNSAKVEKVFNVGEMDIEVIKVETKNFKLGGVAKMDITLRSNWNDKIEGLFGELLIKDEEGDPVADLKTASVDMEPHSTEHIFAYWETEGLKEGAYNINLKLKFLDKVIEKQLVSYLSMDALRTTFLSATGQVIGSKAEVNRNTILSIAIIILIILNISWFIYFKKKMKK